MKATIKRIGAIFAATAMTLAANAVSYPSTTNGTAPNEWTRNFSGVMSAAQTTGYPVLLLFVGSNCAHCEIMMENTIRTAEFAAMEKDLVFYKVLVINGVSGSTDGIIMGKYSRYLNGGMFPITAILRKDGSVYGAYGNSTTDRRGVAPELRDLIEKLSVEQIGYVPHQDGTSTDVAPEAPADDTPKAPSAAAWAVKLKGKANGIVFDAAQEAQGTLLMKFTAKGVVTAKITTSASRKNIKGTLALDEDGNPYFAADGLEVSYDPSLATWVGAYNGGVVVASAKSAASYAGLYTAGAESADGAKAGYFTATAKGAKCKVAGLVNGRNKVSASGVGVPVPAKVVAANLPNWDAGGDIAFYPLVKRGVSGAVAVASAGDAHFDVHAAGYEWVADGGKWSTSADMRTLDGQPLTFKAGEATIEIPLAWSGKGIAAAANAYKAKFKPNVRKGIFKGSAKINGAKYSYEGALLKTAAGVSCVGTSYGAGVSKVSAGEVSCDSCDPK